MRWFVMFLAALFLALVAVPAPAQDKKPAPVPASKKADPLKKIDTSLKKGSVEVQLFSSLGYGPTQKENGGWGDIVTFTLDNDLSPFGKGPEIFRIEADANLTFLVQQGLDGRGKWKEIKGQNLQIKGTVPTSILVYKGKEHLGTVHLRYGYIF